MHIFCCQNTYILYVSHGFYSLFYANYGKTIAKMLQIYDNR